MWFQYLCQNYATCLTTFTLASGWKSRGRNTPSHISDSSCPRRCCGSHGANRILHHWTQRKYVFNKRTKLVTILFCLNWHWMIDILREPESIHSFLVCFVFVSLRQMFDWNKSCVGAQITVGQIGPTVYLEHSPGYLGSFLLSSIHRNPEIWGISVICTGRCLLFIWVCFTYDLGWKEKSYRADIEMYKEASSKCKSKPSSISCVHNILLTSEG